LASATTSLKRRRTSKTVSRGGGGGGAEASAAAAAACWEEADEDARLGDVVAGLPGGPYAAGGWVVAVQVA